MLLDNCEITINNNYFFNNEEKRPLEEIAISVTDK